MELAEEDTIKEEMVNEGVQTGADEVKAQDPFTLQVGREGVKRVSAVSFIFL